MAFLLHQPTARSRQHERKKNQWLAAANAAVKQNRFVHSFDPLVHCYDSAYDPVPKWKPRPSSYESINNFWGGYGILPIISDYSERYRAETYDKAIVLKHVEQDRIKIIPYYTRFSDDYYLSKYKELARLKGVVDDGIFLTLTLDPKRFFNLKDAYTALMQGWNRLKTYILKHDRNPMLTDAGSIAQNWAGDYIAVVEFQSRATKLPHLHILLINCSFLDWHAVKEHWYKWTGGQQVMLERIRSVWKIHKDSGKSYRYTAIDYLLKYMKKAAENLEHLIELWALNARAYNCSRGVGEFLFNRQKEDFKLGENSINDLWRCLEGNYWVYVGTFPKIDVEKLTTWTEFVSEFGDSLLSRY